MEELKTIMLNVQSSVTSTQTKFGQFENNLQQVMESNQRLEESNRNMNEKVGELTTKVNNLEKELKTSQQKCENLEAQSRRENLRIYGFEEKQPRETWEETEELVRDYIQKDLEIDESRISIERAHRLSSKEKPRPVIVKFSFYKDRDRVLKKYKQKKKDIREAEIAAAANRGSNQSDDNDTDDIDPDFRRNIHICEDVPARVMKARNDLRPFLKKTKSEGREAYIKYDTLIIDDGAYIYDEESENIVQVEK